MAEPTDKDVYEALAARREAYKRVSDFLRGLARENSELGVEARDMLALLRQLRPFTH